MNTIQLYHRPCKINLLSYLRDTIKQLDDLRTPDVLIACFLLVLIKARRTVRDKNVHSFTSYRYNENYDEYIYYIYIYIYMYVCIKEYLSLYFSYICITIQRIPIKKSISSKSIVSNENISIIPGFFRITKILRGSFLFFRHFVPVPIFAD